MTKPSPLAATLALCDHVEVDHGGCDGCQCYGPALLAARLRVVMEVWPALERFESVEDDRRHALLAERERLRSRVGELEQAVCAEHARAEHIGADLADMRQRAERAEATLDALIGGPHGALPKIRQRSEIEDCGQDGVCKLSPGCNRHWEERNRELLRENEVLRSTIRGWKGER